MTTKNIHGGLTLVQIDVATAKQSGLWLVKRGETILGMLEKYKDSKSYYHPWKAWAGHGMTARFLGAFYEPRKGWEAREDMDMGGKNAAINVIVNAAISI
jgi:hypothetical protein